MAERKYTSKHIYSTKELGDRLLGTYKSEATAKRKAAEIRRKGYRARATEIMGGWEVWVSPRYYAKVRGKKK